MHTCHTVICGLPNCTFFDIISWTAQFKKKKVIEDEKCFDFLYSFFLKHFLNRFFKRTQIKNFMKIHSVGAMLFHADRRMERQTDMLKKIITFWNFANMPIREMWKISRWLTIINVTLNWHNPSQRPDKQVEHKIWMANNKDKNVTLTSHVWFECHR